MANKQILLIAFTLMSAFALHTASAQNLEMPTLDNRMPVLNGRAFLTFPGQAKPILRYYEIIPNTESPENQSVEETMIKVPVGTAQLTFFVKELFAFGEENLFETVALQNEKAKSQTKILTRNDSLLSILSWPMQWDSLGSILWMSSLLVKTQDNTLFEVRAFIDSASYGYREQLQQFTESIFSTLEKGTRENNLSARLEKYRISGTDKTFSFKVPAGYCVTTEQLGIDFQIFSFRRYQNYSDTNGTFMMIQSGSDSSRIINLHEFSKSEGQKVKGDFLNKKMDWLSFYDKKDNFYIKQLQLTCDDICKGRLVDIQMLSTRQNSIDELTQIVKNIEVEKASPDAMPSNDIPKYQVNTIRRENISVQYPTEWVVGDNPEFLLLINERPEAGWSFLTSFDIQTDEGFKNTGDFCAAYKKMMAASELFKEFKVESERYISFKGFEAMELHCTATAANFLPVEWRSVIFLKKKKIYKLTTTSLVGEFDLLKEKTDRIFDSFTIK